MCCFETVFITVQLIPPLFNSNLFLEPDSIATDSFANPPSAVQRIYYIFAWIKFKVDKIIWVDRISI